MSERAVNLGCGIVQLACGILVTQTTVPWNWTGIIFVVSGAFTIALYIKS